jgi:hypothetical protein
MTHDIIVTGVNGDKPFGGHLMKWNRSIENFSDSASFKVPGITRLRKEGDAYERVQTGLLFKEGMKVELKAGYNGENDLRFMGFIRRVNFTLPLEVECEGYSYQLRKKLNFTKNYKDVSVRDILNDLVQDTDIVLSDAIPDVPIRKAVFKSVTGIQVLDWLKSKCLLTVYFNFNTLYVGAMQVEAKTVKSFRLGWNVIKDNELKFDDTKEFADVRIQLSTRKDDGQYEKAYFGGKLDGQVKKMYSIIDDASTLKKIAEQKRTELVNRGYEGSITTFLSPFVEPGMAVQLDDAKYPERTGKYFVSGVAGEFSTSGGRQVIKLGNSL